MVKYDPEIIEKFATAMYQEADKIILSSAITYGVLGLVAGALTLSYLLGSWVVGALLGGALGAFIGYRKGEAKAFELKLAAQTALCQVEIEKNSR